ncbi:uncharacterized protein LOC116346488 [Contarinia nasturtii]|uniref:uncharacterized protein LOC116346488 n=1 Tax=Contarinia nasturtii TaxID=265458 RepID=UPI0012D4111B|nr:uncharacterized protein LOC116346488 [Contarinia nasturtii]
MRQIFIVIFLAIYVFEKACGEVTYATIIDKFHRKIDALDREIKHNWIAELTPLFSLFERLPYLEPILGERYMINNLETAVDAALASLSPKDKTALLVRNDIKEIIGNQWKINELGAVIQKNVQSSTAHSPFYDERIYRKFEFKKIENLFILKVEQKLGIMKSIHKDLHDLFVDDVENVRKTKASFANETLAILDTFQNCKNPKSEVKELKSAIDHYKKIQDDVWKHLVNAEKVLDEYFRQRYLWTEFLLSFKSAIEKRPMVLQERKPRILEMGKNQFRKIAGIAKE